MIFHVVNERHLKKRPLILTTNKSLKAWSKVLHDDDLAEAITARNLELGRLLKARRPIAPQYMQRAQSTACGFGGYPFQRKQWGSGTHPNFVAVFRLSDAGA